MCCVLFLVLAIQHGIRRCIYGVPRKFFVCSRARRWRYRTIAPRVRSSVRGYILAGILKAVHNDGTTALRKMRSMRMHVRYHTVELPHQRLVSCAHSLKLLHSRQHYVQHGWIYATASTICSIVFCCAAAACCTQLQIEHTSCNTGSIFCARTIPIHNCTIISHSHHQQSNMNDLAAWLDPSYDHDRYDSTHWYVYDNCTT